MPDRNQDVNNRIHSYAERAEGEVRRLIQYLNDEVVPDVRRESSVALRKAAEGLQNLAEKLEDRRR